MGFAADAIADVITPPPRAERAGPAARDDGPSFAQHLDKQDDAAAHPEKPRAEKPTAERPHRTSAAAADDEQDTSEEDTVEAATQTIAQPQTETTPAAPLLAQFLAQLKSAPSADAKPAQTADTPPPAQAPQQGDAGLAPQLPVGGIAGQAAEPQQAAQQAAESLPQLAPVASLPGVKTKGAPQTADRDTADSAPSVAPAQAQAPQPEATAAIVQTPVAPDTTPQAARETKAPAIDASAARTAKTQAPPEAPAPDTPPPAETSKSATPLQQALSALRDGANAANSGEKNTEIRIAAPAHTSGPASAPIAQPAVQTAPASVEHAAAQRVASAGAQVGHEIVKRFSGGNTRFEMRLDPPELGRIEVRLEVSRDNKVSAVIAADSPQALSDLVRHARDLEASLQSAGLDLAENGLSFDLNQSGQRFGDQGDSDGASARQGAASNDDPAPVTAARPLGLESWRGVRIDVMA